MFHSLDCELFKSGDFVFFIFVSLGLWLYGIQIVMQCFVNEWQKIQTSTLKWKYIHTHKYTYTQVYV